MDNGRRSDLGDRRVRCHDLTQTPLVGEIAGRSRVEKRTRHGVRTSCDDAAHKHCGDGSFEPHRAVVAVRDRLRRRHGEVPPNGAPGNHTPPKKVTVFFALALTEDCRSPIINFHLLQNEGIDARLVPHGCTALVLAPLS